MEPPKTWVVYKGFLQAPSENPQPPESPENAFFEANMGEGPQKFTGVFGEIPSDHRGKAYIVMISGYVVMLQKVLITVNLIEWSLLVVHPTCPIASSPPWPWPNGPNPNKNLTKLRCARWCGCSATGRGWFGNLQCLQKFHSNMAGTCLPSKY